MSLSVLSILFLCCFISQLYVQITAEEVADMWYSSCDSSRITVPSYYNCDIAEPPDDVTLADVQFGIWHEASDRYFRIEEHTRCYTEANATCERLGGTLVNLDPAALTWIAENLGDRWYSLWTAYRPTGKGTVKSFKRTCVYEPSTGQEPAVNLVFDECLFCECLSTLVVVQDGAVLQKLNRNHQCNIPLSVLCEKTYD